MISNSHKRIILYYAWLGNIIKEEIHTYLRHFIEKTALVITNLNNNKGNNFNVMSFMLRNLLEVWFQFADDLMDLHNYSSKSDFLHSILIMQERKGEIK